MKFRVYSEHWGVFSAGRGWPQALQVCCDIQNLLREITVIMCSNSTTCFLVMCVLTSSIMIFVFHCREARGWLVPIILVLS